MKSMLFLGVCFLLALVDAAPRAHELTSAYSFEQYCKDHNKVYHSLAETKRRSALFERNLARILKHNAGGHSWKAGVNRFTDHTEEEFQRLNGVSPHLHREVAAVDASSYVAPVRAPKASSVDWRGKGILTAVKDQGQCGSCWTFGTTETVEAYWAMKTGLLNTLSEQFILDCTPNPKDCGGTGGCQGATATMALDKLIEAGGQPSEWTNPYISYAGENFFGRSCPGNASVVPIAKVSGIKHLPPNASPEIIMAQLQEGPLIVNVDASTWQSYESGVFPQGPAGCPLNATIDHVVQLVGYGTDAAEGDYWIVRNSWSPQWGEKGFIRLSRETGCGTDNDPMQGNICTGGPSTVPVCGTCGIGYAALLPVM